MNLDWVTVAVPALATIAAATLTSTLSRRRQLDVRLVESIGSRVKLLQQVKEADLGATEVVETLTDQIKTKVAALRVAEKLVPRLRQLSVMVGTTVGISAVNALVWSVEGVTVQDDGIVILMAVVALSAILVASLALLAVKAAEFGSLARVLHAKTGWPLHDDTGVWLSMMGSMAAVMVSFAVMALRTGIVEHGSPYVPFLVAIVIAIMVLGSIAAVLASRPAPEIEEEIHNELKEDRGGGASTVT